MRIERYPFCARRCLSKKEKETGRELNGSLDRSLLFLLRVFGSLSLGYVHSMYTQYTG